MPPQHAAQKKNRKYHEICTCLQNIYIFFKAYKVKHKCFLVSVATYTCLCITQSLLLQTVGKLSNLATDQLYAEQKWVTSYLKTARNEADKESRVMQKFLTENVLTLLQQVDGNLQDQTKTLETLQQNLKIVFKNIVSDRHDFINSQRKMLLTASSKLQAFTQLQDQELSAISEREEKLRDQELEFGARFREAKLKIDGLLSSLFSEYESYSGEVNHTAAANNRNIESATSRNQQVMSLINTAVKQTIDTSKDFSFKAENREKLVMLEMNQKLTDGLKSTKAVDKQMNLVESQTKQFIGERQGAWELHYNSQEMQLREKADTNKELLQKHQAESQVRFVEYELCSNLSLPHSIC